MLDSYHHLQGHQFMQRAGTEVQQAENLYNASSVVVAHSTHTDPVLNYSNAASLKPWKISIPTLLANPSRMTAEAVHCDDRDKLLARTTRSGYVDEYCGIRIATDGQRFLIDHAIVWNLSDSRGTYVGQAATFKHWTDLEP